METKKILDELTLKFPEEIREASSPFGDDTVVITGDALPDIVHFLRKEPYGFTMLLDLTCVDYPDRENRFEMVYHLYSLSMNRRLRVKIPLSEKHPSVPSLTSIWKNADWLEREVYDMFGVHFHGRPDLRRLFMYDGFEGHPLRKDYPLRKRQPRIPLRK